MFSEKIMKNPDFFMNICESITNALMLVDPEGNITYFNRAAEEITGYKREEVLGKQCTILDSDTCVYSVESGKQKRCNLFENGGVIRRNCQITSKDGRQVYLIKNASVIKDESGKVVGGVEIMTDITSLYMKDREIEELKKEIHHEYGFEGILGTSPVMQGVFEQIKNASMSEAPVIIYGESGTGKELVASIIHRLSRRKSKPFVKVNCASLNEFLLESELFGHKKGAFTGAFRDRKGRFEAARDGSIFLDEIGDMPTSMQIKLLRVLQENEVEPVGDHRAISVNTRLITATNQDLDSLVDSGKFREDLFYRVHVIPLFLPPLREKMEDLPVLLSHFLRRVSLENNKNIQNIDPQAMEIMKKYDWPGNVRQLINALEFSAISCKGNTIAVSDLPDHLFRRKRPERMFEKKLFDPKEVVAALALFKGNRTRTAEHLKISRVTLWKRLKELGIEKI